jgi:hypothetical protein
MKVFYKTKKRLIQEFQQCLESRLIQVTIYKMLPIQFVPSVNLIQRQHTQVSKHLLNQLGRGESRVIGRSDSAPLVAMLGLEMDILEENPEDLKVELLVTTFSVSSEMANFRVWSSPPGD